MSFDYLDDLEKRIDRGDVFYACPGPHHNEWFVSTSLDEMMQKGRRTANSRRYEVHVYRLISKMDTVTGDSYLVVRKIFEPGPRGEPHLHWSLVDTREAAEMLRDVSQGPSPYFGATVEATITPS
jgi:hypothetical protein